MDRTTKNIELIFSEVDQETAASLLANIKPERLEKLNIFSEQIMKQTVSFCTTKGQIDLTEMSLVFNSLTANMLQNAFQLLETEEAFSVMATMHYQLMVRSFAAGGIKVV